MYPCCYINGGGSSDKKLCFLHIFLHVFNKKCPIWACNMPKSLWKLFISVVPYIGQWDIPCIHNNTMQESLDFTRWRFLAFITMEAWAVIHGWKFLLHNHAMESHWVLTLLGISCRYFHFQKSQCSSSDLDCQL